MTVIVLGGMNEGIDGTDKTNQQFHEKGRINLMKEYMSEQVLPRTSSNRGKHVIDHVWVTANVLEAVHRAG